MKGDIVYLSFKTEVDDIEWSDSRRVDCGDAFLPHDIILQGDIAYHSKPRWMILNGQIVGGLLGLFLVSGVFSNLTKTFKLKLI